jgi:hypothetical protein
MDNKEQKDKLEQELRFLKDSFEAEVITQDEYDKSKARIEKKLSDIDSTKDEDDLINQYGKVNSPKPVKETIKEELAESIEEPKDAKNQRPNNGKKTGEMPAILTGTKEIPTETNRLKEPKIEVYDKETENESKYFKYGIAFIVLLLLIYFSFNLFGSNGNSQAGGFDAVCDSNQDCIKEGFSGFCKEAGTKESECLFEELPKAKVLVLNDLKNCFNCDPSRVIGILDEWFGPLDVEEIDFNTAKGAELAVKVDAELLPAFILDKNVSDKAGFAELKRAFVIKDDKYLFSANAAGSTFYSRRENIPNKVDLFVSQGDKTSEKAEENLKELLDEFDDIIFNKYFSTDTLAKELNLNTFPVLLLNNQVKLSGVNAAETIKGNFCKLNNLDDCDKELSKNLI